LDTEVSERNPIFETIRAEIESVLQAEYRLPLEEDQVMYSDWDILLADAHLEKMLSNLEIDIIVGVGVLNSEVLVQHGPYKKPVIATTVIDADLQGVKVTEQGGSGIENLNFLLTPYSAARDLEFLYSVYPFKKVAILVQDNLLQGIRSVHNYFEDYFVDEPSTYQIIPVEEKADQVLEQIDSSFDAVYFGPIFSMDDPDENRKLIEGINGKKLPSFALAGQSSCRAGVMASASPDSNFERIGRRVAVNIQKYLDGEELADLPVRMKYREEFTINMETLRQIDYYPTWDILSDAILLNEDDQSVERQVDLLGVIHEALDQNLELDIEDRIVDAAIEDVAVAKSAFLPQISVSNFSRIIDEESASSSFGSAPEFASTISGSLDQLVFSESARANRDIQQKIQESRVIGRNTLEMDIVLETSEAYLNVLKAKTLLRIQRENLSLNRKNLDLAQIRNEVGYSGPSDLYRWQSSIALAQASVNDAEAVLRQAEMQLNQLLNRPIAEKFRTVEVSLANNYIITNDPRLFQHIDRPDMFDHFSDFMVEEGMRNLPELRQLDKAVDIQERGVLFSKRDRYLPTVGVRAGLDEVFYRGGAGTDIGDLGIPGIGGDPNTLTWSIGLNASLPIFTGNRRTASLQKAQIDLSRSHLERDHFTRQFEQRIRNSLEETAASYTNIELNFAARDAARSNLDLVQDAYSQGLVPVIQLIDAQNATIQAEEAAANAIYEFVISLIRLERSIGNFYSLASDTERNTYFARLEQYMNERNE